MKISNLACGLLQCAVSVALVVGQEESTTGYTSNRSGHRLPWKRSPFD